MAVDKSNKYNSIKSAFFLVAAFLFTFSAGYITGANVEPCDINSPKQQRIAQQENSCDDSALAAELQIVRSELSASQQKFNELASRNARLSELVDKHNIPINGTETFSSLIEKLDNIPTSVVDKYLERHFGEDIRSHVSDTKTFAKKLLEVALDDEHSLENESGDINIEFSLSPIIGVRPISSDATVSKYNSVFAHVIPTGSFRTKDVLLKWENVTSGELVAFRRASLSFDSSDTAYFTAYPNQGWKPATYKVSIYTLDDEVVFLSQGSFSISTVDGSEQTERTVNKQIVEELISTGKAWKKPK